ncbi:mitochondrial 54S ribosomal protein YmL19 [Tilletia horrida]|uniref:Large ribosomal subunit protein uL11m n=1 Tax=Tilletia horrida TaxID=155126 RepID=A0AAN6JJR5_9BASI|nr:mitochondrial 54S ribosomal protein YmL19 [Tilletia horrida]KAK0530173.1 mitochondrial 54S ribosomal protein YmL19 [Tilletia horrida]KAK0530489.1 mitochondrial 54S ribosomal protein YmL19 [Tilletia horrida]KAK0561799.1 mitochondrial 54S ribosomal protein YmL19 [Tilletia horrida]
MSKKGGAAASAAVSIVKLLVPAGKASAQPPVGPALGAKGVKAMDFAKLFNERTAQYEVGVPIPTEVTINPDRTFTFVTHTPPVSHLLKRCAGISTGSGRAGAESAGIVSAKHIYEIAKIKVDDVKGVGEEQMARMIVGQARSMGLRIVR